MRTLERHHNKIWLKRFSMDSGRLAYLMPEKVADKSLTFNDRIYGAITLRLALMLDVPLRHV